MEIAAKLILFLPLISGIINGIFCMKLNNKFASATAICAIFISTILSFYIFSNVGIGRNIIEIGLFRWANIGSIVINAAIYIDQLTSIMFLLVTTVSTVVHIYSLGYMESDKNLPKFLSYLSLFTFFMLILVASNNFVQLFFGWEGVGVCSYLLIGYYYTKDSANNAAIKAFIVNRVGDCAFIIGVALIIFYTGNVDFKTIFASSELLSKTMFNICGHNFVVLDVICLMLFIGCMGKSAQIGLHVWLPDAMEGPTPVSALIHAATMVTAGVFLVVRCSFMFEYSPSVLELITIVGAITSLFAALIAISQNDIKKIIAYSTCSQLGYMFFACGVSAYNAGIFHLVTHGFFKALLFLSAGSVIHACHEQNIFKLGGLRKKMPITYANFWIGSLAIIGIYPFAGFYSKDFILESAYISGGVGKFAFIFGILSALLTAFYSMKIIVLTFHGKTNLKEKIFAHTHESPNIMNIPLLILTLGATASGMIGYYILNMTNLYGFFFGSIFNLNMDIKEHEINTFIELLPMIIGLFGTIFGFIFYKFKLNITLANKINTIYIILKHKFFFDEIYDKLFVGTLSLFSYISDLFDRKIIDRLGPGGFVYIIQNFSYNLKKIHTGYIVNYISYIMGALIISITFFIVNYGGLGA